MSEAYNWEKGLLLQLPTFPKIHTEYQHLIDSGDFSKLEDLLMEHFDTAAHDIAYYLPAYRFFIRKQEVNRVSALLGLHVESLREHHDLAAEVVLLQTMLGFWPGCKYARDLLHGHLKAMYPACPKFGHYTQHTQILDEASGVEKFRQLELWLRYDEGRVVYIPSKGVARIREANTKIGVVRMVFKNDEQMTLRLDEAEHLAQPFLNNHFLARTILDTDTLNQIAINDPGELLRLFFASVRREVSISELQEMLSAIVSESLWNAWWARVRKDPRLIVGSGTKPVLNWNDSVDEGSAGLMATFRKASVDDKLAMLKKYAARSETMTTEMAGVLVEEASEAVDDDPSLALEIVLTISGMSQCKDVAMPFDVEELFSGADGAAVIAGIRDRLARKKAVQLVAHSRSDWPLVYGALLRGETDTSLFKVLYEALHAAGHDDVLAAEVQRTFASPIIFTRFFLWLCKELPNRPELHNYANWEFIRVLLGIIDNDAFKGHHSVLRKLFDPGEVVDRAIESIDAPTGRTLLDVLSRNRSLEDYIKENARQKIFLLFPELLTRKSV